MMDLSHWHDRLTQHFAQLRTARMVSGSDRPLFALEHGLDDTEVKALSAAVRAHIAGSAPSRDHSLPWIVYAAELGYRYSGDEYWQTFESETPGWVTYGDRYWVRDAFRAFRKTFGGAEPSGPWADHFSIICWPITHAILPRDLQRQLARILYELRHSFSAELFESPSKLGEFIAARSWNATSRFQNLAQETQLVGQIAAALLLQGKFGYSGLILPTTLRRIGEDLDRERRAREWLRGARRFAEERVRVHGLGLGRGPTAAIARRPEEAPAQVVALGIEPRLVLRPTNGTGESWEVRLEIPDLSHLLVRFPQIQGILTGSRCVVAGAAGRPLARGRCLYGAQQVVLARWPCTDEVLLQFEQTDPQLEYLLRAECLLRPGTIHLFRVASDGCAYELRGMRVRPGERYVLVNTSGGLKANTHVRPVALSCKGAEGAIISLPEALDAEWEGTLRALGLGQAKCIEVWPAGLSAVVWDGEGRGEWLESERPCLAILTDHQVDALFVSIGGGVEDVLEITPIEPGEPVFVELPPLPVGLHTVRVGARGVSDAEAEQLGDLHVMMRIREARPWTPGVSLHGPLIVQMDPSAPTLEQLWEGRAEFTVRGPTGRNIKCRATLFERDDAAATIAKQLPPISLPVTPEGWRVCFDKHFRGARDVQGAYDTARVCELEFSAEELGAFSVRCEREFTPLRWAVRRRGQEQVLRLVDDSGSDKVPRVARLAFETPSVEEPLDATPEYRVPPVGGLYVARIQEITAAVIVPPSVRSLGDLQCNPRFDVQDRSVDSVIRLITLASLWGQARLPGDFLSTTRRRTVLQALSRHVFRLIGGGNWSDAEVGVGRSGDGIAYLKRAISKRPEEIGVGAALALDCARLATAGRQESVDRLSSLGTRYLLLPSTPRPAISAIWFAEFALRLASDIAGVHAWSGQYLRAGASRLLEYPTLARAARFLVIATDKHLQSRAASGELYAGWIWA